MPNIMHTYASKSGVDVCFQKPDSWNWSVYFLKKEKKAYLRDRRWVFLYSIKQNVMTPWQLYAKNAERRSYVPSLDPLPQLIIFD